VFVGGVAVHAVAAGVVTVAPELVQPRADSRPCCWRIRWLRACMPGTVRPGTVRAVDDRGGVLDDRSGRATFTRCEPVRCRPGAGGRCPDRRRRARGGPMVLTACHAYRRAHRGGLPHDPDRAAESSAGPRTDEDRGARPACVCADVWGRGDVGPLLGLAVRLRALGAHVAQVRVCAPPDSAQRPADSSQERQRGMRTCPQVDRQSSRRR
jgi:hypothetical protein